MMFCSKQRICCIAKFKQNVPHIHKHVQVSNAQHSPLRRTQVTDLSVAWHQERLRADDQTTETIPPSVFTGEETNQLAVCAQAVGLGCTLIFYTGCHLPPLAVLSAVLQCSDSSK